MGESASSKPSVCAGSYILRENIYSYVIQPKLKPKTPATAMLSARTGFASNDTDEPSQRRQTQIDNIKCWHRGYLPSKWLTQHEANTSQHPFTRTTIYLLLFQKMLQDALSRQLGQLINRSLR